MGGTRQCEEDVNVSQVQRPSVKEIRQIVNHFLVQCNISFSMVQYDLTFHKECYQEALHRGYPIATTLELGRHSLHPFIPGGVVMATTAYSHLTDKPTRIFIALYTAFLIYLDDAFQNNVEYLSEFNERFIQRQPQEDRMLDAFADHLYRMPQYFGRVACNLIVTSTLNLVTALLLEVEMQATTITPLATKFPTFVRGLSGAAEAYALFAFPLELPLNSYMHAIPEILVFINSGNDVLSFYKENIAGELVSRIPILAKCCGVPQLEVICWLADDAISADTKALRLLAPHQGARDAYRAFRKGYIGFHASLDRYKLSELLN